MRRDVRELILRRVADPFATRGGRRCDGSKEEPRRVVGYASMRRKSAGEAQWKNMCNFASGYLMCKEVAKL